MKQFSDNHPQNLTDYHKFQSTPISQTLLRLVNKSVVDRLTEQMHLTKRPTTTLNLRRRSRDFRRRVLTSYIGAVPEVTPTGYRRDGDDVALVRCHGTSPAFGICCTASFISHHILHCFVWVGGRAQWLGLWLEDIPLLLPGDHTVGKVSAIAQQTRPTQPCIPPGRWKSSKPGNYTRPLYHSLGCM